MVGTGRARRWLRSHPGWADALLALLVLTFAVGPVFRGEGDMRSLAEFGVILPLACACLVLRRRYPAPVWVLTTVLGLVGVVLSQGPTTLYLPAVVALYSLSVRTETRQAAPYALISALAPVLVTMVTRSGPTFDPVAFALTGWSGVGFAAGVAVRTQRELLETAYERAREAEASREEEAQRRVTEERLRIARDLHDVVAHHVSVINVQAGVAGHLVRRDPDAAAAAMAHVREASQTVLREVPALLGLLRTGDESLETAPAPRLADADVLVERARRDGATVVWQTTGTPVDLSPGTDLTAYRVMQEALTNAVRYGDGRVLLRVEYAEQDLVLEARNRIAGRSESSGQHGLLGMRERVLAAGGTLSAGIADSGEWVVHVVLPVQRPAATPEMTPNMNPNMNPDGSRVR